AQRGCSAWSLSSARLSWLISSTHLSGIRSFARIGQSVLIFTPNRRSHSCSTYSMETNSGRVGKFPQKVRDRTIPCDPVFRVLDLIVGWHVRAIAPRRDRQEADPGGAIVTGKVGHVGYLGGAIRSRFREGRE